MPPLNTQPNYILNSYPNIYAPSPNAPVSTPTVAPPVVSKPWNADPSPSATHSSGPSEPYSGQGNLNAADVGKGLQAAGTVVGLLGGPTLAATIASLAGKGFSMFGGSDNENDSVPDISMSGDAGIGGGTGVAGNQAATQSANDPQPAPTGIAADGQGSLSGNDTAGPGAGPKIICNELYRQGYMPKHIWEADERFGATLDARTLEGYHRWAEPWVRVMQRSRLATRLTWTVAKPWAEHMAFRMRAVEEDNPLGRAMMKIGLPLCKALGKRQSDLRGWV